MIIANKTALIKVLFCIIALSSLVGSQCTGVRKSGSDRENSKQTTTVFPYDLENPNHIITLASEDLKEISGLSPTDTAGIFCAIADERGEIFFIDCNGGGAITRRVLFKETGDFEGVEQVGKTLYASKSNGDIYEIIHSNKPSTIEINTYKTGLKKEDDVEGLGYSKKDHSLLLACKSDPSSPTPRNIYAFSLKAKTLSEKPVYSISPEEVNALVPYNSEDKNNYFSPSGIAVHPITGDIFVVSTALKRLVVLEHTTGKIRFAFRLDKKILPQPEGISFNEQGNLFLSSEGKKGEGSILQFKYQTK